MADSKIFDGETEKEFKNRMTAIAYNGFTLLAIAMGRETGLFAKMIAMEMPKTCQDIADAAQLKERYVREWLGAMVTSHIVNYDPAKEQYWLPKHHHCITQSLGLAMCIPTLSTAFFDVAECFRQDGPAGVAYEKYAKFDSLMTDVHGPLFQNQFITEFFPSMPEIQTKLESGIKVLDIGCGAGTSTTEMAKRFPKSQIYGVDLSEQGIKDAQTTADAAGLTNVTFACQDVTVLPSDWTGEFGYALAHMIIHDLTDPPEVLGEILRVLSPGGALSVVDPKAHSNLEDNMDDSGHSSLLYTISMMNCIPTSLCMGKGAGLGAVVGREKMQKLLEEAGYQISSISDGLEALHYLCIKPQ